MPAASRRTFYAIQAAGISRFTGDSDASNRKFYRVAGLQTIGINTNFNVEALYQLGKLDIYSNVEGIPEIEVSMEKPLDGSPLIYEMATMSRQASAPTGAVPNLTTDVLVNDSERSLIARSNARCNILLSIHSDSQSEVPTMSGLLTDATGPLVQCVVSGAYISQVSYKMGADGNFSESASFVANDKKWFSGSTDNGFSLTASTGLPTFKPGTSTLDNARQVLRKQHINWSGCLLPKIIPGVDANGKLANSTVAGTVASGFSAHIQSMNTSVNLGRESLNELGRRSPYFRYVKFPVEVTTEIEVLVGGSTPCDFVSATQEGALDSTGGVNVDSESILIQLGQAGSAAHRDMIINLGKKNILTSVNYQGGGTDGGNSTATYSFRNFNNFTVLHELSESKLWATYVATNPFGGA